MPTCVRCSVEKAPDAFYPNDRTCKECRKALVRANRAAKIEQYRAYDRERSSRQDRVEARRAYQKTDAYLAGRAEAISRYRHNHPGRSAANTAVAYALRNGSIERLPCFVCGKDAEAHHPDYSNKLGVVWLCIRHHADLHEEHREYLRATNEISGQ